MMTPGELRGWLLIQPRPTSLRIVTAEAQTHKLDITGGMNWKQTAESVIALQPDLIEAYDDKGGFLRAVRPADKGADEDEDEPLEVEVPTGADAESVRLVTFAKLLSEAYRHSTDVAFDKLGQLFDTVSRRAESQEKTIASMDRLLQKLLLEKVAAASGESTGEEGGGGPLTIESMLGAFLQGKAQSAIDKPATNGVHKEVAK